MVASICNCNYCFASLQYSVGSLNLPRSVFIKLISVGTPYSKNKVGSKKNVYLSELSFFTLNTLSELHRNKLLQNPVLGIKVKPMLTEINYLYYK